MEILINFLITFVVVYLFYVFFVLLRKKKLAKVKTETYALFLKRNYKVEIEKLSNLYLANAIALSNSFIIGFTIVAINFIDNLVYKFILAFAILLPLQLIAYYIIAKILKRRIKHV